MTGEKQTPVGDQVFVNLTINGILVIHIMIQLLLAMI